MKNLLGQSSVKFWLNKACGSKSTRKSYLQNFTKFCKHNNVQPDAVIQKWKTVRYDWKKRQEFLDEWSEKIEIYVYNQLENLASLSKASIRTSILSFFQHHKIRLEVSQIKHPHVTYHNRDISKNEIKRILNHCTIRNEAFFLMMVESGLRPATLCELKYENIKDDFKAERVPMKIDVPARIVKDRVGHRFTFIGEDGFKVLKEYLSTRPSLNDNDYLFMKEKQKMDNKPVTPASISTIFGSIVLKLKLDKQKKRKKPRALRLYCLRKYFRNRMKVRDTSYREFWMGHSYGTDEHYLTRDVETHREVYREAYPSFRIYHYETELNVEELKKSLKTEIEAKLRAELHAEYEQKLKEQVREIIREEMAWMVESNPETRHEVEDFIFTHLKVKPDDVKYQVSILGEQKIINVLGYWKNGKYVKLEQPAKITKH